MMDDCYDTEAEYLRVLEDLAKPIVSTPEYWVDTRKPFKIVNGVRLYKCTRCGQYKPKSDFYKDRRVPCGIRNKCKICYHKKARANDKT